MKNLTGLYKHQRDHTRGGARGSGKRVNITPMSFRSCPHCHGAKVVPGLEQAMGGDADQTGPLIECPACHGTGKAT